MPGDLVQQVRDTVSKDDWHGISDPVERRKRQTRLRQRAWRERKSAAKHAQVSNPADTTPWKGYGMLVVPTRQDTGSAPAKSSGDYGSKLEFLCNSEAGKYKLIPPLLEYSTGTATISAPAVIFPLSADHCLITLVQYNVLRAVLFNLSILSAMDHLPLGCGRYLNIPSFGVIPPKDIPVDLQSNTLQASTPHVFWIDALPFPKLRDNMILQFGTYDSNDLYYDLGQSLYEGLDDAERRGFVAWGDPWRGEEWEMSEGFVKKWGFLLKGCSSLVDSTNYWREIRGEERLIVEIS